MALERPADIRRGTTQSETFSLGYAVVRKMEFGGWIISERSPGCGDTNTLASVTTKKELLEFLDEHLTDDDLKPGEV